MPPLLRIPKHSEPGTQELLEFFRQFAPEVPFLTEKDSPYTRPILNLSSHSLSGILNIQIYYLRHRIARALREGKVNEYFENRNCSKCGNDGFLSRTTSKKIQSIYEPGLDLVKRTCGNCNHIWRELPKDRKYCTRCGIANNKTEPFIGQHCGTCAQDLADDKAANDADPDRKKVEAAQ